VVREDLVRLAQAPLYLRMPELPAVGLAAGQRILIDMLEHDLLDLTVSARFVSIASTSAQDAMDLLESVEDEGAEPELDPAAPASVPGAAPSESDRAAMQATGAMADSAPESPPAESA
jgi:hypothetical protein